MSIVTGVQSAQVLGPAKGELFKFQSAKHGAGSVKKGASIREYSRELEHNEIDNIF
jgi:hypothetical protein